MATTDEFWDVDGVSLNELCWNIETLTGRARMPSKRGENIPVPYRDGAVWVPKNADQQVITLAMWVLGCDENGEISADLRGLFNDNWRALARLFWTENALHTVTKRWLSAADGLIEASTECEIVEGIDLNTEVPGRGVFTVDLVLPRVFFFGEEEEVQIPLGVPTTVTNPGDATLRWMEITLEGGLVNPQLTNSTPAPDVWVGYGGTILDAEQVDLDTENFTAHKFMTATPASYSNVVGAVSRSGARHWMVLAPGDNTLTLTATSGDGQAFVRYRPPYF